MKSYSFLWILWIGIIIASSDAREITHEDIKDAMLSLVHMMRENTEKLERHEVRERQLGEQLKKTVAVLTKKVSAIEGFKIQISKLEDKISGIEQIITQRDERERIQMQRTADSLEDLENRLEGWFSDIENKVSEINSHPVTSSPADNEIIAKLDNNEALLKQQISQLNSVLKATSDKLKEKPPTQTDKPTSIFTAVTNVSKKLGNIEDLLKKMEQLSNTPPEKSQGPQYEVNPVFEEHTRTLNRIKDILEDTSEHIGNLPKLNEEATLHNETRTLLQETKHTLKDVFTRGVEDVESKIKEFKEEAKNSIEALRLDLANNAERVNQELRDLGKGQSVMVSMADHVLDTKKRVEYGVHRILLEIGDLVNTQSANINHTLNSRFDGISNDIMDNQNGALANLTTKMEQEMNQVWRQINVMYQQMMESAKALDKLHKQNEVYVNGTTSTMGGMESKVSEITKRMSEVDENLNYLLGRLSLVTQEFNQIKTGLGAALDNIKASFKEVQEKANDLSNPGPHPVPYNYKELNESETKKPDVVPVK